MQNCGVRVPSRPALQRLAAGDAASDSDAAEPESPAQKRHIIITRLGGASVTTRSGPKCKKKAAQKRRNKLEELPRSDRNGPLCGEQCDGVHSFYWSVGIGAPPPCHGHRACHGHLAPSPLSWPPSQWLCDAARTATQPSLAARGAAFTAHALQEVCCRPAWLAAAAHVGEQSASVGRVGCALAPDKPLSGSQTPL